MKQPVELSDREIEALAYFFLIFWCAVVLAPGKQRQLRATMVSLGLVEPRGPLKLTRLGLRVIAFAKDERRPRYGRKAS